jgi:RimJ/RimL family protein N-acetyltransferase
MSGPDIDAAGAPVGPAVDARPAELPGPVALAGRFGSVARLDASRHGEALWQEFKGHDRLWSYMSDGPFAERAAFLTWLETREALTDPYYYAVLDREGRAVGVETLMSIRPAMRVIEVGNIVLGPSLQRSPLATETQYLLARYAIETLRYRRYEWKCYSLNAPSRNAALRFGFKFEGIFRNHMIIKGRSRDTAWFAMTEEDWPARKAAFERWLDPANFDAAGKQKQSLRELNGVG